MKERISKLKAFFQKNEQKIVIFIGFCLISAISYEFGVLQGQKWQQKPLVIEKPAVTPMKEESGQNEASSPLSSNFTSTNGSTSTLGCAFVGSKNSDKFYVPSCQWAKRIKPENLVCYKSEQEALDKGKAKSDCK